MSFCINTEKAEETIKVPAVETKLGDMCQTLVDKVSEALDEKLASFEDKNEEWCRRQEEVVQKLLPRTDKQILAMNDLSEIETQTEFETREMCTQTEDDTDTLFSAPIPIPIHTRTRRGSKASLQGENLMDASPHRQMSPERDRFATDDSGAESGEPGKKKKKKKKNKVEDMFDPETGDSPSPDEASKGLRQSAGTGEEISDLEVPQSPVAERSPSKDESPSPMALRRQASSPSNGTPTNGGKKLRKSPTAKGAIVLKAGQTDPAADLELMTDMSGTRDIDTKMKAVAIRLGLAKYPKFSAIVTRTDGPLSLWVKGPLFKIIANILVFANIFFIVLQAENSVSNAAKGQEASGMFATLDLFFTVAFALDLLMRVIGERLSILFTKDRLWNYMDIALVLGDLFNQVINLIMSAMGKKGPEGIFGAMRGAARACRAGRVARTLRIFRSFSFFSLPREVVAAFGAVPFMLVIYFFIALFFGLIFMQAAAESQLNEAALDESKEAMAHYFGSVGDAVITLVLVLLRAMDWIEIYLAIAETSKLYSWVFLVFAFFAIVAFMNAITAMCVQCCMARVQKNEMEGRTEASVKLTRVLAKNDKDSTPVTWGRLQTNLDNPIVRGYLENLGLDVADAKGLCKLMGRGDNTQVDLPEFARACVKFTRAGKGADLLPVLLFNKRLLIEFREFTDHFHASMGHAMTKRSRSRS